VLILQRPGSCPQERWGGITREEREARRATAFLADTDGSGRVVDFHALRHTFITRLARSGVVPAVAKSLARHSTIVLTMDHYTHTLIGDERAALDRLPGIAPRLPAQLPPASGGDPRKEEAFPRPRACQLQRVVSPHSHRSEAYHIPKVDLYRVAVDEAGNNKTRDRSHLRNTDELTMGRAESETVVCLLTREDL
jgi:hypothetical protein